MPSPVILFPINGCEPDGTLTPEQQDVLREDRRRIMREHRQHQGVRATVEFVENVAAQLQQNGLMKGSGEHGQGAGWAAGYIVAALRAQLTAPAEK